MLNSTITKKNKEMTSNETGRETAEFNMAVGYLNRLNTLFYLTDEAAMTLNVESWMHGLLALFRELSTEMTDKEINELKENSQEINNEVQQIIKIQQRTGRMNIPTTTYNKLHDFELKLRKILKSSGLQMKMKQSASGALE